MPDALKVVHAGVALKVRDILIRKLDEVGDLHAQRKFFAKHDKSGDGEFDFRELKLFLRGELGLSEEEVTDSEIHALAKQLDDDGSGSLSIDELLDFVENGDLGDVEGAGEVSVTYDVVRQKFEPDADMVKALAKQEKTRAERAEREARQASGSKAKKQAQQQERREWLIKQMELALQEWPPSVRKAQPKFTTASRSAALAHIMEAGTSGARALLFTAGMKKGHVRLQAPGVRQCLRNCCEQGLGLGGLAPMEAVETFYVYCAERLQSSYRGHVGRKAMVAAMKMWHAREEEVKEETFAFWRDEVRKALALRRHCWRKLRVWRKWTRALRAKHHFFRETHWPFHVWRRCARRHQVAHAKAKFLARCWRAIFGRRHIKAWRIVIVAQIARREKADAQLLRSRWKKGTAIFADWARRGKQRLRLKKSWYDGPPMGGGRSGRQIAVDKLLEVKFRVVNIWRYWTYLAQVAQIRAARCFRKIHHDVRGREAPRDEGGAQGARQEEAAALPAARRARGARAVAPEPAVDRGHALRPRPARRGEGAVRVAAAALRAEDAAAVHGVRVDALLAARARDRLAAAVPRARGAQGPRGDAARRAPPQENLLPRVDRRVAEGRRGRGPQGRPARRRRRARRAAGVRRRDRRHDRHDGADRRRDERGDERRDRGLAGRRRRRVGEGVAERGAAQEEGRRRRRGGRARGGERGLSSAEKQWMSHGCDRVLDNDRSERAQQGTRLDASLDELQQLMVIVREADASEKAWEGEWNAAAKAKVKELDGFCDDENARTDLAAAEAKKYMGDFHLHAARKIFECMTTVRAQVQAAYERQLAWHAFRALRVAWSERRTRRLAKRQRLRYYLAMCARLRYLERGMPIYRRLRVKWTCVQRRLALCENHYAWVDPALPIALKRRRALYVKFGRKLESHFLRPRQYPYDVLGPLTSDQRSCFHRWQAYVQTRACRGAGSRRSCAASARCASSSS